MTMKHAEYLVAIIAVVLVSIIAVDRHWRMEAATQRADGIEAILIECQTDLAAANGGNG